MNSLKRNWDVALLTLSSLTAVTAIAFYFGVGLILGVLLFIFWALVCYKKRDKRLRWKKILLFLICFFDLLMITVIGLDYFLSVKIESFLPSIGIDSSIKELIGMIVYVCCILLNFLVYQILSYDGFYLDEQNILPLMRIQQADFRILSDQSNLFHTYSDIFRTQIWIERNGEFFQIYIPEEDEINQSQRLNSTMHSREATAIDEGKDCPICYEPFEKKNQVGDMKLFTLSCGHTFHGVCIRTSIKVTGRRCPYCRQSISNRLSERNSNNLNKMPSSNIMIANEDNMSSNIIIHSHENNHASP